MMLLDKGYYDYDFEPTKPKTIITDWESTIKSDDEVSQILNIFGIGKRDKKPETIEEIQNYIIKEESKNEC